MGFALCISFITTYLVSTNRMITAKVGKLLRLPDSKCKEILLIMRVVFKQSNYIISHYNYRLMLVYDLLHDVINTSIFMIENR